jgi:hypothetical protein
MELQIDYNSEPQTTCTDVIMMCYALCGSTPEGIDTQAEYDQCCDKLRDAGRLR